MSIRPEILEFSTMITRALNFTYQGVLYEKSWRTEFAWKETKKYMKMVEDETLKIDIKSLSNEEMSFLGFPKFDENHYCMPCYFHKAAIAQGYMTEETDTDNRFGGMWVQIPMKAPETKE